jgi:hypothetical protein
LPSYFLTVKGVCHLFCLLALHYAQPASKCYLLRLLNDWLHHLHEALELELGLAHLVEESCKTHCLRQSISPVGKKLDDLSIPPFLQRVRFEGANGFKFQRILQKLSRTDVHFPRASKYGKGALPLFEDFREPNFLSHLFSLPVLNSRLALEKQVSNRAHPSSVQMEFHRKLFKLFSLRSNPAHLRGVAGQAPENHSLIKCVGFPLPRNVLMHQVEPPNKYVASDQLVNLLD